VGTQVPDRINTLAKRQRGRGKKMGLGQEKTTGNATGGEKTKTLVGGSGGGILKCITSRMGDIVTGS